MIREKKLGVRGCDLYEAMHVQSMYIYMYVS